MSRYHHLVKVHAENAGLITSSIKSIVEAIEAGELNKAKRAVMALENQTAKMQISFEEMSLLVRVMMLEFQIDDDKQRANGSVRPRNKPSANRQREVQLELFALWTEIHAKQRQE